MNELSRITDKEIYKRMCKAEKEYDLYAREYRARGLHEKPYCELSALGASPETHEFRNGLWQRKR